MYVLVVLSYLSHTLCISLSSYQYCYSQQQILLFMFTLHVDPVLMLVLYTVALTVVVQWCSVVVYSQYAQYSQPTVLQEHTCSSVTLCIHLSTHPLYNISSLLLVATVNSQCYCQCWSYSQWLLLVVLYAYAGQRIEGHVVYCTRLCMLCYTMLYYVKLCSILSTLHAVYLSYYLISSLHLSDGLCILLLLLLVVLA